MSQFLSHVPVADLLLEFLRVGGERLADTSGAGWVIRPHGRHASIHRRNLHDQGVRDGATLVLVPAALELAGARVRRHRRCDRRRPDHRAALDSGHDPLAEAPQPGCSRCSSCLPGSSTTHHDHRRQLSPVPSAAVLPRRGSPTGSGAQRRIIGRRDRVCRSPSSLRVRRFGLLASSHSKGLPASLHEGWVGRFVARGRPARGLRGGGDRGRVGVGRCRPWSVS